MMHGKFWAMTCGNNLVRFLRLLRFLKLFRFLKLLKGSTQLCELVKVLTSLYSLNIQVKNSTLKFQVVDKVYHFGRSCAWLVNISLYMEYSRTLESIWLGSNNYSWNIHHANSYSCFSIFLKLKLFRKFKIKQIYICSLLMY